MAGISGKEKTVSELLANKHYTIDYYQREYKWQEKQLQELIEDLTGRFDGKYDPSHERSEINKYGQYFLGSIILCEKDDKVFIIDGQQRLTTLTLLLIYLRNNIEDTSQQGVISNLIYSQKLGDKSYNINVEDRKQCMDALFAGIEYDYGNGSESVKNIMKRYNEIDSLFPEDYDDKKLIFFSDWLMENVVLVKISSEKDEEAYTIFETMNDRGLSLRPLDMLKGYLLAQITDLQKRNEAAEIWKKWIKEMLDLEKDVDTKAFKEWFIGRYAETMKERKKEADPMDFDRIGNEFHRWFRDNDERMGLRTVEDYYSFIRNDLQFYLGQYAILYKASISLTKGLETVFYNAKNNMTLQYPLIMASLAKNDDQKTIKKKINLVSSFIDIFITRRIWNSESIKYDTMRYIAFPIMIEIRNKNLDELKNIFLDKLNKATDKFKENSQLAYKQRNHGHIHHFLARLTDYLEMSSGSESHYLEYVNEKTVKYEVEHIWADKPERHEAEFPSAADFLNYRNKIGGLLLLPKSFNDSYNASPYEEKLPHYYGQNYLAKSLNPTCYEKNPNFLKFKNEKKLPFKPHEQFKKQDFDERQELYRRIAELVWSPERITRIAEE